MKITTTDIQLLASEYAGHCLSKMPSTATEDEKIERLYHAYKEAHEKIREYIKHVEPPMEVRAF